MSIKSGLNIKLSDCRNVLKACNNLHSEFDFRFIMENIALENPDFYDGSINFVIESHCAKKLSEEMESDLYILGCYNASFIANHTDIPLITVEALQKTESFEELGVLIKETTDLVELAEEAIALDGVGHFFNHYDGYISEEITIDGTTWLIFDNR